MNNLFTPGQMGRLAVKNRIVLAPIATNFASEDGGVTERLINFYAERARGGVGTIIIENATIDYPEGNNGAVQLRINEDRYIPGLSYLADTIHQWNARAILQINHSGPTARQAKTGGRPPVGPSPVRIFADR